MFGEEKPKDLKNIIWTSQSGSNTERESCISCLSLAKLLDIVLAVQSKHKTAENISKILNVGHFIDRHLCAFREALLR